MGPRPWAALEDRWKARGVYREDWHEQQRRERTHPRGPTGAAHLVDHFGIGDALLLDAGTYGAVFCAGGYLVVCPEPGA